MSTMTGVWGRWTGIAPSLPRVGPHRGAVQPQRATRLDHRTDTSSGWGFVFGRH